MRWLAASRVKSPRNNDAERGAISVLTAVCMVVLVLVVALVVNVGIAYAEKSQLQNGADAAALAVAQKCADRANTSPCIPGVVDGDLQTLANSLVNGNSNDATSAVLLEMGSGEVTATTSTLSGDGARIILPISGIDATVRALAAAGWGGPSGGTTAFPLTFADCQFDLSGEVQLLEYHMTDEGDTCISGSPPHVIPGGFGWLQQVAGECGAYIDIDTLIGGSDTGNNGPSGCNTVLTEWATKINAGEDAVVILPVYDDATGEGSGGTFHMRGFAAFQVLGWKFHGSQYPLVFHNTGNTPSTLNCTGSCRGIIGKFIEYTTMDSGWTPGGPDLGAHIIGLTK